MRIRRLFVAGSLAIALGVLIGLIRDDAEALVVPNTETAVSGLSPGHLVDESDDLPRKTDADFAIREIDCLTNIIYREARGESAGIRRLTAIVTIARRDDIDPQWPRTICKIMAQSRQISGIERKISVNPVELRQLAENREIAADVYDNAWTTQLLPRGWECVRYWKVSDEVLARMSEVKFKQLGIGKQLKGLTFFSKLAPVPSPPGKITFYRDPKRCMKALPTT